MKLHYDAETDSLYIELCATPGADADEIAPGVVADFDADGRLVGLDIEHTSKVMDLAEVEIDGLPTRVLAGTRSIERS